LGRIQYNIVGFTNKKAVLNYAFKCAKNYSEGLGQENPKYNENGTKLHVIVQLN